jgi:hypothetical protein
MDIGILVLLAPLWPLIAVGSAVFFYARHSRRIEPAHRVPPVLYVAGVIIGGAVAGILGLGWGIRWACSDPNAGNLCGLFGFLVAGPIAGTLGVVLVGSALSLVGDNGARRQLDGRRDV